MDQLVFTENITQQVAVGALPEFCFLELLFICGRKTHLICKVLPVDLAEKQRSISRDGVQELHSFVLNFLHVNVFFQSFCFPTERHHLSKHAAQRHPCCHCISTLLFHVFVKQVLQSVNDDAALFNINTKRKHTTCILLSLKLMLAFCHFSSVIVVITLVCKEYSYLSVSSALVPFDSFMSHYCIRPGP